MGDATRMRPFEAIGDTAFWGQEPTTVVLVLAADTQEVAADVSAAKQGATLTQTLTQDEVWVTKQKLHLHVSRHAQAG